MPDFSSTNYVLGGKAMERMWLIATKHGISIQPMMTPLLCFARLENGAGNGIPDFMKEEYTRLYRHFNELFPGIAHKGKILLFKLSIAEKTVVRSCRKPVDQVLLFA